MATQLFANNASSTLASGITAVATSATLATGQGALFPTIAGSDWFLLTLTQPTGPESIWEIVKVTARTTDTLTIVRAQEGTTGAVWATGVKAEARLTAGSLIPAVAAGQAGLLLGSDKAKLDALSGTNSGDNAVNSLYSSLVSNATHTGDVSGATILTLAAIITAAGPIGSASAVPVITFDAKGRLTAVSSATITPAAIGAQAAGTYATGTGTAYGTNTGDETLATIKTKLGITTLSGSNTGDQTLPTLASLGAYAASNPSGYITISGSINGSAASLSGTSCSQNGDGWWRSTGATGWYSTTHAVGIYATEAGNVRTYNGANFISAGTVTGTNLSGTHTGSSSGTNTGDQTNISGNATTAGGLAVHTGVNSVANQIVRTNASGYCDFGWINTVSGVCTGTPARVYCSEDAYLRYYSMATFTGYVQAAASGTWGISISGNAATSSSCSGNAATATRANGNFYIDGNYGQSIIGVYSSTVLQGVYAMGSAYMLTAAGGPGTLYGLAWSHPNAGGQAANLSGHGLLVMANGGTLAAISDNIWCSGQFKGAGTGLTGTAASLSIGGNAATSSSCSGNAASATTSGQVTVATGRTDSAWYNVVWNSGNYLYSPNTVQIRSSGYGAIGFNGSAWYFEGNASYGIYSNTGLYAAGGLWDAGNRVYSAGNPQGSVSGSSGSCTGNAATVTTVPLGSTLSSRSGATISYGGDGGPQVYGIGGGSAILSFHRPGSFAANFGLDTDNVWKVGGWSMGAVAYPIYHAGNPQGSVSGSSGSCTGNAATASSSVVFMSTSHAGSYYLVNNWTGVHWQITSNHGAGVRVAYADTAGSAPSSYASSIKFN